MFAVLVSLWDRISNEPVLVSTFVGALLTLFVAFGAPISDDQKGAVIAVTIALLALFTRSRVTPV